MIRNRTNTKSGEASTMAKWTNEKSYIKGNLNSNRIERKTLINSPYLRSGFAEDLSSRIEKFRA